MEGMGVEVYAQLIGSLGFPIFTAIWFMKQSAADKKALQEVQEKNTEALVSLKASIDMLAKEVTKK